MKLRFTEEGVQVILGADPQLTMPRSRFRAAIGVGFATGLMVGGVLMILLLALGGAL
jgi:hypothetical protein